MKRQKKMEPLSLADGAKLLALARNPNGEDTEELITSMTSKDAKKIAQELLDKVRNESQAVVVKRGQIMPRVVFVWADDWVATYIDGVKQLEGHSIDHHTLLNKLGIEYESLPVDQKWFEEEAGCYFSDSLQDVQIGHD